MSFDKQILISRTAFDVNGDPVQINANSYVHNIGLAIEQLVKEYRAANDLSAEAYVAAVTITGDQIPFDEVHTLNDDIIIKSFSVKAGQHAVQLNPVEEPIVLDDTEE